jgi:hypothetical protein
MKKLTARYDAERIDWYDYWINLHVPALRRWTYPLIEGRRPETGLLPRSFKLHSKTDQPEVAPLEILQPPLTQTFSLSTGQLGNRPPLTRDL